MKANPSLFSENKIFFTGCAVLFLLSTFLLVSKGNVAAFIFLNPYHSPGLDRFFIYFTHFGDGLFAVGLILILFFLFKKKQMALALLYAFLLSGLIAQVIKNTIRMPRPRLFFEPGQYTHYIDGVSLANTSSLPSGHTATAFAVATVLAIMIQHKNWQLVLLLAAASAGYSRIFLAQHFLFDVLIGAITGVLSGIFAFYLSRNEKFLALLNKVPEINFKSSTSDKKTA